MYQIIVSTLLVFFFVGCSTIPPRNPVPEEFYTEAKISGIDNARVWGDIAPNRNIDSINISEEELRSRYPSLFDIEHNYLVISGGGARGAYAAGLLKGWTENGSRPNFSLVTGISTGALIAPFAFLGSDYDSLLEEFYTQHSTKDLLESNEKKLGLIRAFFFSKESFSSVDPLLKLLEEYITDDLVKEIAGEFRKGRLLMIGTTNLDAMRPVYWNIGQIANSGHPNATKLIRQVILASISIPVLFPPVMIQVDVNGQPYDELHVDGGVTNQAFLNQADTDWTNVIHLMKVIGAPNVYIIRNAKLEPEWKATEPQLRDIGARSVSSLMRTQGIGDVFQIYSDSLKDGLDFHLTFIPSEFVTESQEIFDQVYMTELFEVGYELGKEGTPWYTRPVSYSPKKSVSGN